MHPARRLTYLFLDLPHHKKLNVAQRLKLIRNEDQGLQDAELYKRYFERATDKGILADLWREVQKEYGREGATMGETTESIFNGKTVVIPMADVQHIEKKYDICIKVITKHTTWNYEHVGWENEITIWIKDGEAEEFMKAWCRYRSEIEAETLQDLTSKEEQK